MTRLLNIPLFTGLLLAGALRPCDTPAAADYQLQTLENAHRMFSAATNSAMYAAAAQQ
jgi:hypothetical protein